MTTKGDMVDYDTERQRLGIGSTGQVLTVASSLPTWATLTTADSVLTTQGDVLYESASGLARLGFGTDGDVLTTKGTGADPEWSTPSAGGATVTTQEISPTDAQTTTSGSVAVTGGSATLPNRTGGKVLATYWQACDSTVSDQIVIQFYFDGSVQRGSQGRLATTGQREINTISCTDDLDGGTFSLYWGTGGGTAKLFNAGVTTQSRCTLFEVS
jgi:hypothetical protein